jgi:hypothetical protein
LVARVVTSEATGGGALPEEIEDLGTTWGDWSSWGTPAPVGIGRWRRCHWRAGIHRWRERDVTWITTYTCPPDYVPIGGDACEYYAVVYGEETADQVDVPVYVRADAHTWPSYGPWTDHSEAVGQVECQYSFVWLAYQPLLGLQIGTSARDGRAHRVDDLSLVHGDRLTFRGGKRITSVCVDGTPIDPRRTITASKHDPGTHVIDVYGRYGERKAQLRFLLEIGRPRRVALEEPATSASRRT